MRSLFSSPSDVAGMALFPVLQVSLPTKMPACFEVTWCRIDMIMHKAFFRSPGTPSKRSAIQGYQPAYGLAPQPVPPELEPPPQVVEAKLWATVARSLGAPDSMTDKSFKIKRMYTETLLQFERVRPWAAPPRDISLGSAGVLNALCRAGACRPVARWRELAGTLPATLWG